jgi:sugar phosphate isomerase/epimerase
MANPPDLLATCWTSAGDVVPARNGDVSPWTVEERVAAVAKAGYKGFGIAAPDLAVVRDTIGYAALAQLLEENGLRYVEVEYLQDWWTRGDRRRTSDEVREVLVGGGGRAGRGPREGRPR